MQPRNKLLHFVRELLGGDGALARGTYYVTTGGRRAAASDVMQLVRAGAIDGDHAGCRANGATAGWLKRMMIDCDAFQAQHRQLAHDAEGRAINLKESPLMRLAAGEAAFLERHHVETGERVRRLVERAQLRQRLTMSYSGVGREGKAGSKASEISEMAADARRAVADIYRTLPPECAGVVVDVCGWLKGLQEVERERGWPRRSAKLVLRIGLDQLARHYGIDPHARGRATGPQRGWIEAGARPALRL